MDKIERMTYEDGRVNTAFVDKINEIIEVLNERGAQNEEERILWVNENCKVVEFCCDDLEEDFADYYDIVKYNHYIFGVSIAPYYIGQLRVHSERKLAQNSLYLVKCPYCGASIKCRCNRDLIVDAIRNSGVEYSKEDLKDAVEILKRK